jgi:hypothetical protein
MVVRMSLAAILFAAGLLAPGPRPGLMVSACTRTVLSASLQDAQLDRDVRDLVDRFHRIALVQLDPQIGIAVYAPRGERFRRYGGVAIRRLLVGLGVEPERIRLIQDDEATALYGPQPKGTLILSAPPDDRSCGQDNARPTR